MKDKLSDGIDNANAHIDTLIYNAKKAAELVNAKIAEQHKVIDGVAADLSRMERQLAGMKPGTAQKELAADVMACRKVLDEERNTLVYQEQQHRQAVKAESDVEKAHALRNPLHGGCGSEDPSRAYRREQGLGEVHLVL